MRRPTILATQGIAALFLGTTGAPAPAQDFLLWSACTNGSTVLSRTGDIDGDGVPDLLVTLPTTGGAPSGQVRWLSGSSGATVHLLIGGTPDDGFGTAVADAGDVDGDGLSDAIVGAPYANPSGLQAAGQARVFSGTSGALLLVLNGWSAGDHLGWKVLGLGDLTADGHADPLVGAPSADPGGLVNAGQIRVFSGSNGLVLYTVTGPWAGAGAGGVVLPAGDLDLDGLDDAIAFLSAIDYPVAMQGEVRALSGATGQPLYVQAVPSPPYPGGSTLALVGDLDADGATDWALGLPTLGSGGTLEVFSGAAGSLLASHHGTATSSYGGGFGTVFGPAGDMNGDGHGDLAVGMPSAAVNGVLSAGEVLVYSGADQSILHSLQGTDFYGALGSSVAAAGDVDGDGADDLLVGAPHPGIPSGGPYGPWWTPNGPGEAFVFSGATGESLYAIAGSSVSDNLGYRVWGVDDLSGDGRPDLMVFGAVFPTSGLLSFSFTGIPSGSSLFGSGCPGASGTTAKILAAGGDPSGTAGNATFGVFLAGAPAGTTALLLMGLSAQTWGSVPLPMGLATFGMPDCALEVAADFASLLPTNVSGNALAPLPVPKDPGLAGAILYFQWLVADPGPALLPGAMSGAIELLLL